MIDRAELQSTIAECIDNPSSSQVCQRLASYYVIQDHLFNNNEKMYSGDDVSVLPAYDDFAEAKRSYQQGEGNEQAMIERLNALLSQMIDLIHRLYVNANTEQERSAIMSAIQKLKIGNF